MPMKFPMTPAGIDPTTFRFVAQHLNSLKAELSPICHLLALLAAHHILHVSRIRVNYCATAVPKYRINARIILSRTFLHRLTTLKNGGLGNLSKRALWCLCSALPMDSIK
jgi:hypothetical protein